MYRFPLPVGLAAAVLLLGTAPLAAQDTWTPLNTGTAQTLHAVHFVSADVGYVAGDAGTVLKTTDGGATWTDVSPGILRDFYGLYFFDANEGIVVGSQGAIGRTLDGGATWSAVGSGTSQTLYSVDFAGDVGIVGAGSQTILRSANRGASWSRVQGGFFGGGFYGVDMLSTADGFVAGENSIFQPLFGASDDGGMTFAFTAFYLNSNEGQLEAVHFLDAQVGVTAGQTWDGQGALSRTTDGGQTWTTTLSGDALFGLDFAGAALGYAVGAEGALLKTEDGGQTWTVVPSVTAATLNGVSLPTPATGYAAGENGTVLKGTIPSGAPLTLVVTPIDPPIEVSPGEAFQFTVAVSNTGSTPLTFDLWAEALHPDTGLSLTLGPRTVTLPAGASREVTLTRRVPLQAPAGAYTVTVFAGAFPDEVLASDGFPVTVLPRNAAAANGTALPAGFALEQNVPNPVSDRAVIRYTLPEEAHVALRVYDALGREVAVLAEGAQTAGRYEVVFDAGELPAGVYLYRLEAGGAITARTLLITK
jgi:photosystem II stability/assembly factor-like uncharacterized protein